MSKSEIRDLLAKLRDEMRTAELDAETRSLVQELESDIHDLLGSDRSEAEIASVLNRAKALEANFEAEHPITVRILSEVIASLARMGI